MTKIHLLNLLLLFMPVALTGQSNVSNFNCNDAFTIPDPIEWCSENGAFTTENAGGSEFNFNACLDGSSQDVWFKYVAFAKATNIVINGESGGDLDNPRVALYSGDCNNEISTLRCETSQNGQDIVNLFQGGLTLGETYYIRVTGSGNNSGSFQICINSYNPPVDPGQDANTASNLCDKSSFVVQVLGGGGANENEAIGTCLDVGGGDSESQSTWFTWIAENNGQLTFSINPLNASDDLDWVVYEFPNGLNNTNGKVALRCMASSCIGPTGLDLTSTDVEEVAGCAPGDDNFLRALDQEAGKAYGILINNFTQTGVGFELEFGGDAEFQGPVPDFEIDLAIGVDTTNGLTCDKLFDVTDISTDAANSIIAYEWNFGEGANPQTATGAGPHSVTYSSFGEKYVVLTVTSDRGCIVTAVDQVMAAACCDDIEDIELVESIQASGCEGERNGSISVTASGGFPDYLYNFQGGEFTSLSTFSDLEPGDYSIGVQDRKGCETFELLTVGIAAPISVDAGPDMSVEFLGDDIQLEGSFMAEGDVTLSWIPENGVDCGNGTSNCVDPIIKPPGTTTYTFVLLDENGCTTTDEVTIEVEKTRPIFAPNVFSPNEDGINDVFYLIGSELSVLAIQEFTIFDRWGNKVYNIKNIPPSDLNSGWDGSFNGNPSSQGVYTWTAKILYLDSINEEGELVSGDITLIR